MRVIIAGGRNVKGLWHVTQAVAHSGFKNFTEIVSGGARGADQLGEVWAETQNIPIALFPANWDLYGRSAGPIRNKQMADYADALIALWDGQSRGTKNMIDQMQKQNKPVFIWAVPIS
jgi:hypothetical protein